MKKNFYSLLVSFALLYSAAFAQTGTRFNDGYITVYKATSPTTLSNTGTAIVAEEYNTTTAAQTAPNFSVAIPTAASNKLVVSGTATASGGISRSENGRYLLMPGYNGLVGDANSTFTTNGAVRTINASGTVGAGIAAGGTQWLSSSNNLRGATSDDGTNYWISGNGVGIQYSNNGTSVTTVTSTSTNNRDVVIYNGQLYLTSGAGLQGIYSIGSGKPQTTGNTSTRLFAPTNTDPYAFSISPDGNTIYYVASTSGGIYRSTFDGTSWSTGTRIFTGTGYTGLAVDWNAYSFNTTAANGARIFACNPSTIIAANDNGTVTASTTVLRTEPVTANNAFRQLAFSPSKQSVSLGSNSPAAGTISTAATDAVLFQFNLSADEGNSTLKKLILNQSGSATIGAGNDISNFKLIEDANNNGVADAGELSAVLATGTVAGADITFGNINLAAYINEGASKNFIVTGDISATASNGHTFIPAIVSDKILNGINYSSNISNAGGSWINIGATAPNGNTLTINTPAPPLPGTMRITEYMYNGSGSGAGEFVEFTNIGTTPVSMNGWSFDDSSELPGSQSLSGFGTVQPGESVIFTDVAAATFRSNWALCSGIKIIGNNTNNLGREDEINLYNASNMLVDRLTYGDQTYSAGSIRTTAVSGWVNAAGLGNNIITDWRLSAVGDAEASYTSGAGEIGSPGKSSRAIVAYNPCLVVNGAPTIVMNVSSTTNYIDNTVTVAPTSPFSLSAVISDPTDPAKILGIDFTINDAETAADSLLVTATSSNAAVVPNANISITGTSANRNIKIIPIGIGYATITITVSDGTSNTTYALNYAASAASATPASTFWHTGMSDGSDGLAIDDNYYISADDELDVLNVYSRSASGLPYVSYDYAANLALPDPTKPEVDVEATTGSPATPNKVYWLGSMSNGKAPFNDKPNRNRIFATTHTGTGAATTFTFAGYYGNLRQSLITWGDANGYNFSASAAPGVDSKTVSGFAAEGMVFGPDNTTLYVAFRAPLVPTATRTKAVIAPIVNFEAWFNNGSPVGSPVFGPPIELDLGGRGFRDITRLSNGTYIIVAGNPAGSPVTSAIYKWTGNAADAPIMITTTADGLLNLEGVMQVNTSGHPDMNKLQVISDGGDEVLYADGTAAKDFNDLILRKFRSDDLTGVNLCMTSTGDTTVTACSNFTWHGTTYSTSGTPTQLMTSIAGCDSIVTLHLTINAAPDNTVTENSATTFCQGDSVIFTTAAGNAYQWQLNGGNITGATANTYIASVSGNYSVIVTNAGNCTSISTAQTVIVNALPDATVTAGSASTFCDGGTVTFTTATSGNSYQWQLNGGAIGGATGNNYTASVPGNYSVIVTNANSCTSTSTIQTVTVNALPDNTVTVSAATAFCQGDSVILSAASGLSYQWILDGVNIAGANAGSYTAAANGNYSVEVSNASCDNTSVATAVTVNSVPSQPVITQVGNTLISTAASAYQWYYNGTAIGGATSQTYEAAQDGNYMVVVSNSSGCGNASDSLLVTVTGIASIEAANAVNVYPNPYSGSANIQLILAGNAMVTVEVFSMIGEKVQTLTAQNYSAGTYTFAFGAKQQGYAAGVYIVKATINGKMKVIRIMEN